MQFNPTFDFNNRGGGETGFRLIYSLYYCNKIKEERLKQQKLILIKELIAFC